MTTYDDIIGFYGSENTSFYDIEQKEINKISDLLATYLYHKYPKKYNGKIIDFLSLETDKIADFLTSKEKSDAEKLKAYDEFHSHLIENLSEHFSDDIDDDIDQSYAEHHSKESYEANEADIKLTEIKEQEDNCFKKVFDEAYHNYNKARLQYFKIINLIKYFEKVKEIEENELCQKA